MAIANKLDPVQTADALSGLLAGELHEATDVQVSDVSTPWSSGYSCETILFKVSWQLGGVPVSRRVAARIAPATGVPTFFPANDLALEAKIMRALARKTVVAAPDVHLVNEDASVIGSSFLIMQAIEGRVPPDDPPYTVDGWVLGLTEPQQRTLVDNAVSTLAAIATVDWQELGLRVDGRTGLEQQLAHLKYLYDDGRNGVVSDLVERGMTWLHGNAPDDQRMVLCWGDARLGNMMFGDDLDVVGVLDWENASIGSPEIDLAYFLWIMDVWSDGFGVASPPGFPSRAEIIARFEKLSGYKVKFLEYYERFAGVFGAIMAMRSGRLLIDAGVLPADSNIPLANPASAALARQFGDAIDGPITTWGRGK